MDLGDCVAEKTKYAAVDAAHEFLLAASKTGAELGKEVLKVLLVEQSDE
jgi:hypothetical protein